MDKTSDLTNQAIIANVSTSSNDRSPLHFPTSDPKHVIIDLITPDPHHASSLHQNSSTSQNSNVIIFENFPQVHQIPTQIV